MLPSVPAGTTVSTPIRQLLRKSNGEVRRVKWDSWPISLLRLPPQSPVAQYAALVEKVVWLLYPPTENSRKTEENMPTRKIEELIQISPRAARLHPEKKGGKEKKTGGHNGYGWRREQSSHPNRVRIWLYFFIFPSWITGQSWADHGATMGDHAKHARFQKSWPLRGSLKYQIFSVFRNEQRVFQNIECFVQIIVKKKRHSPWNQAI